MAAVKRCTCLALASGVLLPVVAQDAAVDVPDLLDIDDECAAAGPGEEEQCSLNAIQRRGLRAKQEREAAAAAAEASGAAGAASSNHLGAEGGEHWPWSTAPSSNADSTWGSWGWGWLAPPSGSPSSSPTPSPGPLHAPAPVPMSTAKCKPLSDYKNRDCKKPIEWVVNQGGKNDPHAASWFEDMKSITGVEYTEADIGDFQRMYYCSPPGGKACGTPPCECSKPPCNTCYGGAPPPKLRPECERGGRGVDCVAPKKPMDYKGVEWPTLTYHGTHELHFFAIGDWGGMDGSLNPIEGRPKIMAYSWGARPGPSVFPRTRWNKYHTVELCNHKDFAKCYDSHGSQCPRSCGYVDEVDSQPQQLVAKAMEDRARMHKPELILNVGDNFYWGGIEKTCGTPMDEISFTAHHQFDQIFEKVYNGRGLGDAPWLSVLGNHDWGGRQFNNGWDQQIAYTWASNRWIMPAPYWMVHVEFPDQSISADIFMLDTNFLDAKTPYEDPEHNICGMAHNPTGASCSVADGPSSIYTCKNFFDDLWSEQKTWVTQKLSASRATWQIAVTHFPCNEDGAGGSFYRSLHQQYGLDFLVTGHRHDQELWTHDSGANRMGGLACIVTGGGGGISSEATPNPNDQKDWFGEAQYGFFDITIKKDKLLVQSINWDGKVAKEYEVLPSEHFQ